VNAAPKFLNSREVHSHAKTAQLAGFGIPRSRIPVITGAMRHAEGAEQTRHEDRTFNAFRNISSLRENNVE
jgi:hypothetical protein